MESVTPILKPDRTIMLEQLNMLFGRAMDGLIEVTAIKADATKDDRPKTRFFKLDDLDEVADWAMSINSEHMWNVYVGAALRRPETFPGQAADDGDFLRTYALWADADSETQLTAARAAYDAERLKPAMVVITGRTPERRAQMWWPLETPISDIDTLRAALRAMAVALGTDPAVTSGKQLMRLAGSLAWPKPKKEGRILELTELVQPAGAAREVPLEQMQRAFPPKVADQPQRESVAGTIAGAMAQHDLRSALASLRSDDRDLWIRMGHALHCLGDVGMGLWLEWSQTSPKYDPADAMRVWDSLRGERTGFQAVFAEAQRGGWANPGSTHHQSTDGESEEGPVVDAPSFDPWERYIVPRFPVGVLPPVLRDFVAYLSTTTGADPAACAMAALASASGAIDQRFTLKMKRSGHWHVRPRMWVILVGDPSTKKTPLISSCVAPLRTFENAVMQQWQRDMARWKEAAKEDRGDEPPAPTRYIMNDLSTEKLGDLLSKQDRGALFENDELSGWIGAMDKYGGGKGSSADRSFWAKAYNGGPITVDRISRGSVFVQNLCLAIVGAIQPDRLPEVGKLTSDGLLQRFLPVMMRRSSYPQEVDSDGPGEAYGHMMNYLISMKPAGLQMDEGARMAADEFQRFIFDLESTEGLGKSFCTFAGKLTGAHGSLALLLHILEDPQNASYEPVSERVVRAATQILKEFTIPHAMEFYRGTTDGADWEAIQTLASFILTSTKDRFRPSDFTNGVRALAGLGTWELAHRVSPMVAGGWLEEEFQGGSVKAWTIVPGLRDILLERREIEIQRKNTVFKTLKNLTEGSVDE